MDGGTYPFDLTQSKIMESSLVSYKAQGEKVKKFRILSGDVENPEFKVKTKPPKKRNSSEKKRKLALIKQIQDEENEIILKEGELLRMCPGAQRKVMKASRDLNGGH